MRIFHFAVTTRVLRGYWHLRHGIYLGTFQGVIHRIHSSMSQVLQMDVS